MLERYVTFFFWGVGTFSQNNVIDFFFGSFGVEERRYCAISSPGQKRSCPNKMRFAFFWRSSIRTYRSHTGPIYWCHIHHVAQHFPFFCVDVRKRVLSDGRTKQMPAKDKEKKRNDEKEGRFSMGKRVFFAPRFVDSLSPPRMMSFPPPYDVIGHGVGIVEDARAACRHVRSCCAVRGAEERCTASHAILS